MIAGIEYKLPYACADCDVNRNPELFGPDEAAYRPERWILTSNGGDESSPEKLKAIERNNDLIFGSGRFQCLGKNVAAIEMNKVIFELFGMLIIEPAITTMLM